MNRKDWGPMVVRMLIVLCIGCGLAASAMAQCELTSGWEPYEPFQYQDGEVLTGLDVDLVTAIVQQANCRVTFQEIPWARLLNLLENGKVHFVMGASQTPEREVFAYFSNPYRTETMALYIRKGEAAQYPLQTLSDLINSSFRLGVTRGYYYGDTVEGWRNDADLKKHLLEADADAENYTKLLKSRIDGFLGDPVVTGIALRKAGVAGQIERHPLPVFSNDIYVMFSKQITTPDQVAVFNQGLDEIKANGIYDQVLKKYLQP